MTSGNVGRTRYVVFAGFTACFAACFTAQCAACRAAWFSVYDMGCCTKNWRDTAPGLGFADSCGLTRLFKATKTAK